MHKKEEEYLEQLYKEIELWEEQYNREREQVLKLMEALKDDDDDNN